MNNALSKKVILHITPHLGGGVGRVLLNFFAYTRDNFDYVNKVISLEYANEKALSASRNMGFPILDKMSSDHEGIFSAIAAADVVVVHWWNHPLLYDLLVRETLPPSRMVFWSHISGYHAPYVFPEPALSYPDRFVFATPISFDASDIARLPEDRKNNFRVIWSSGGIEPFLSLQKIPHEGFTIGYVGTVDYCKMHPSFLSMCDKVSLPDARFVICGGSREKQIQLESLRCREPGRFIFTGMVEDVAQRLSEFDIFGYPLAQYHYGSGEQSLTEAMAAGIAPVVMDNPTERHIVKHGVTGIVAKDEEGYVRGIEELHNNPEMRNSIAAQAREYARNNFSTGRMVEKWAELLDEVVRLPKKPRSWTGVNKGKTVSPAKVFIESLGTHGKEFFASFNAASKQDVASADEQIRLLGASSFLWQSETRGTPQHYRTFFPEDRYLKRWSELLQT